jgi:hypothetical protein
MAQAYPIPTRYVVSYFVNAPLDQNVPPTVRRAGRGRTPRNAAWQRASAGRQRSAAGFASPP